MKIFTRRGLREQNEKLWSDWNREQNMRRELDEIHREMFELNQRLSNLEDRNRPTELHPVNVKEV